MLKKLFFSTALLSIFAFNSKAQVYEKGNMIIDAYYGGPNLYTTSVKGFYNDNSYYHDLKVSSIGPVGARFEYLLSSLIGLGVNINYANTAVTATTGSLSYNGNQYDYKASFPRLRMMGTFNLHLGKNEKFDPYFLFGLGYSTAPFKFESTDPSLPTINVKNPVPLVFRSEFGMRYFFTDNFGLHVQFGLGGGPLLGGGLSLKF